MDWELAWNLFRLVLVSIVALVLLELAGPKRDDRSAVRLGKVLVVGSIFLLWMTGL